MAVFESVKVGLGVRAYDIHIGRDLLANAAEHLPFKPAGRSLFVLADENVRQPAERLTGTLQAAGARSVHVRTLHGGEAAKSFASLENTLAWLLDGRADRQSVLFAVGGGVIGDLGGFAAAVALRGIPFVQVPTTLLAQVDSAVGGKTGINTKQGKNLVGAFHQPLCVLADLDTLTTLPPREMRAGYAEIAKYGLIDDVKFFTWLEANGNAIISGETDALVRAVAASCRKKAEVVEADEREQGRRALLNLGHTFGHALEAAAGYDGRLLHGEAVAIGMVLAFELSAAMGLCTAEDVRRVRAHLQSVGLPTAILDITPRLMQSADELVALMAGDKKAAGGKLVFILARGIGQSFICYDAGMEAVRETVRRSMAGGG